MQKITLQNRKGQKIVGDFEKPKGKIIGTCVVQHGWGSHRNKTTIQIIKNAFLDSGFQTFNFDTTNSFGESDGDFEKSTLGLFAEDFEDVTKWVQNQDWYTGSLAVTGHSKGGYSAVKYSEDYPQEVGLLLTVAPVVSGKFSFEANKKHNPENFKKWQEEGVLEIIGKEGDVKRQHWFQMEERLNHDLLPNAHKLTMPVLFIVGSEDSSCLPEHIKILFDEIPSENKQMKIIEGAEHSYHEKSEQDECKKIIEDWLNLLNR